MTEPQQCELLNLSNEQLAELIESFAQAPYRLRQLLDGLYRQRWSRLGQFSTLPSGFRRQLGEARVSVSPVAPVAWAGAERGAGRLGRARIDRHGRAARHDGSQETVRT
jgi:adenine C2-methylase RlmN of 23S rRNA A2503 and tRNA A37